jgi:hypothetical protein
METCQDQARSALDRRHRSSFATERRAGWCGWIEAGQLQGARHGCAFVDERTEVQANGVCGSEQTVLPSGLINDQDGGLFDGVRLLSEQEFMGNEPNVRLYRPLLLEWALIEKLAFAYAVQIFALRVCMSLLR